MAYLALDLEKKTVINIDETWLGMADFRRRHWRPYRENHSVKVKQILPRISMITAVDNRGQVYVSLT